MMQLMPPQVMPAMAMPRPPRLGESTAATCRRPTMPRMMASSGG